MASDLGQSQDVDLDRTDRLPVLEGVIIDDDVADDSVRMEYTASLAAPALINMSAPSADFSRGSSVDLPSLAESMRSVEDRIARQLAENEALSRSYDRVREAELAATARANATSQELAAARAALDAEQNRLRETERALAERQAAAEAARSKAEESLRDAERSLGESRTLRDSLAARDATIVQVLHSLGERDAQFTALQREHAQIVPVLEARSKSGSQLEADLLVVREQIAALQSELKSSQLLAAELAAKLKREQRELETARLDLSLSKTLSTSYLDQLRTRDWRRGFDLNLFREVDAERGAAQAGQGALLTERNRLQQTTAALHQRIAELEEGIAELRKSASSDGALLGQKAVDLELGERQRASLEAQVRGLTEQVTTLTAERAAQEAALVTALDTGAGEVHKYAELLAATERKLADLTASSEHKHAELLASTEHGYTELLASTEKRHTDLLASKEQKHADVLAATKQQHLETLASIEQQHAKLLAATEHKHAELVAAKDQRHAQVVASTTLQYSERLAATEGKYADLLATTDRSQVQQAALIAQLQEDTARQEEEMAVLMAHLTEARRPLQPIEAELSRITSELNSKTLALEQLTEDNRSLRATLERTRGQLEEREFLIRRLERAESNNANVLGRIQTSMERLAVPNSPPALPALAAAPVELAAELQRVDSDQHAPQVLTRRTRIGRAPGCELQIDSSSVSRHHALILLGPRDVIIEDLNSTNGVIVNGRKVSRQLLNDGDLVVIGEVPFRFTVKRPGKAAGGQLLEGAQAVPGTTA